jgi:dTDP-4-amino-4,6-dideoxygalactose transaminase
MAQRDVPYSRPVVSADAREAVERVLRSGWLTTGPEGAAFEEELADWLGVPHALTVSSCTAAIEIAFRAMRLPRGARVLVPAVTFCGAVEAVVHAGLVPVLADVDFRTGTVSPATCAAAAREAGGVQAMLALHFAGYPADVPALADAAGVTLEEVVEDAAHALGTRVGDERVGGTSRATCFSFYATKNLPIGEGGMITTADEEVADYVRRCRLHGMSRDAWKRYLPGSGWRYSVDDVGLKANMTDPQAAVGRAQMGAFAGWQARRAEIVARYDQALAEVPGIGLPARPVAGGHAWHLYVVRVLPSFGMTRDELMAGLHEMGIDCSVHFIPMHTQPYLGRILGDEVDPARFPAAETAFEQIVSLPLYPALGDEHVDRTCAAIAEAATHGNGASAGTGRADENGHR